MPHEVLDKTIPDFWRGVRPGSVIRLTDEPTLLRDMDGIDYTVRLVETVTEVEDRMEWILFRLESDRKLPDGRADEPTLMVKIVDDDMELRIYRDDDDFEPGNRMDMDERDDLWMFYEPEDPDDFDVRKLPYTEYIEYDVDADDDDDDDDDRTIRFEQKHPEMNGEVITEPGRSGARPQLAVISEYAAVDDYEESEAVIIEIGSDSAMEEAGGLISFMLGHPINPTETDVLTA